MSRYTPVTSKAEMGSEYGVFDQVMGVFGRVRGPFSMLLHSPELTERLLPMVPFAREICAVDPKLRQIAILAAVRERDANYVWAAQVDVARRVGLRELVIDLLRTKGDPSDLPPEERDIVLYTKVAVSIDTRPGSGADGPDAVWVVDQEVPGVFAGFDDIVICVPDRRAQLVLP